jgi:general secretion pathway protein H
MLSLSAVGEDRGLTNESDRLLALMGYARDQAELQTREYGLRVFDGGYEFVSYDGLQRKWSRAQLDDSLRSRELPPDMRLLVKIEGRAIVLPQRPAKTKKVEDLTPQVMLFSSGDLNSFEVLLGREAGSRQVRIAASDSEQEIESTVVEAQHR